MTARTAHDVASAFDSGLGFAVLAIGSALVEAKAIRQADRQAANAIRAQTARLVYGRVFAEEMAAHQAATARAEQADRDERFRMQRLMAAAAAKRARG